MVIIDAVKPNWLMSSTNFITVYRKTFNKEQDFTPCWSDLRLRFDGEGEENNKTNTQMHFERV